MSQMWVAGGPGLAPPRGGTALSPRVRAWQAGLRVRSLHDGPVHVSVVGDCRVSPSALQAEGLAFAGAGRWEDLTRWPGSYWVVAGFEGCTFVAGDLAGVRALFAGRGPRGVIWSSHASHVAAQLASAPDLPLLAAQLVAGAEHWPGRSLYEGVHQVPGGHGLLLQQDRWETVDVTGLPSPLTLADGAARVGQALTEAAEGYASEHEEVGADLSGGLDSSTLVLLAAQRRPVRAVTYGGPLASAEDIAFAKRVAACAGIEHHVCEGGPQTWHFASPPPAATDGPTLSSAIAGLDAAYLAPAAGLGTHLTGHGGDVVLESSTAAFVDLLQRGQTRAAKTQVTAWARLRDQAPRPLWRQVKASAALGRDEAVEQTADRIETGQFDGVSRVWSWCRPGPAAAWLTAHGRSTVAQLLRASVTGGPEVLAGAWDDWSALRLNGASARHEITLYEPLDVHPVYPFLDNAVVRACLAIPAYERRRNGAYKPLLGAALPGLPPWLTGRRSKGSFGPVLMSGLRAHRNRLHHLVATAPLVQAGLVDARRVATDLDRAAGGEATAPRAALQQFLTACLWLDNPPLPPPAAAPAPRAAAC
ncbi:asparagine synthase-related protein [Streptomyces sp. NBC_01789]|uniref:asparagine synthase-related protein n=1 Tax=Streptomyces sp. NBC_01789 TaxID=2975941 RepID=UPI002257E4AD|nr:asparagine synthase-related protein [Streptomyces sp. NBC_01789]MCX4451613.1 asparagine synthase-related protein [Streptomyces sp. NBC_01789]